MEINERIELAETLPADFYKNDTIFEELKESVFIKSWQWIGDISLLPFKTNVYPFTLLEGYLNEPLLLTKDTNDNLNCLLNVCTHRANLVIDDPGKYRSLTCSYHGRSFGLDGKFSRMPGFEKAENFPRPCDDLKKFDLNRFGPHLFVGLEPNFDIQKVFDIMEERIGFLPMDEFKPDATRNKDYLVNCHWALYCDNYLEGFHIPFVHEDLNQVLDFGTYENLVYDHVTLQVGYAKDGEEHFDLPAGHIDDGKQVAAYYYWIFPNMMFNFYPWGLSLNIVKPISKNRTKVSFITYVYDESKIEHGAGAVLDKVEREDEFVVESVQKGLQSRYYHSGRFSPTMEQGVYYFHKLLANSLKANK